MPAKSPRAPYGIIDSWPNESLPTKKPKSAAGSHIGLMQVPVSQPDAWNWLQNTQDGVQGVFQNALNTADAFAVGMQTSYAPMPPDLTRCQLEEMALELYGPHPGKVESAQYYAPQCSGKVTDKTTCSVQWQWEINTAKNYCGVCYVAGVRNTAPPGGSTSTCTGTPPSPDPPINLKQCQKKKC